MLRIITSAVTIESDEHHDGLAVEFVRRVLPMLASNQPVVIEVPAEVQDSIKVLSPAPSGVILVPADSGFTFIHLRPEDTE